jgi:hypothetical protein
MIASYGAAGEACGDRVKGRSALHRTVGEACRQRALAYIQCRRFRRQGAIGVRALLEHTTQDLKRAAARRAD